ncbi:MAG: hypothetical protein ACJZ8D_00740 [Candidatus Pelagibacter sp.]
MKKLLAIVILTIFWCNIGNAVTASCKVYHSNTLVSSGVYDLKKGSEWKPEITNEYIYWRVVKMDNQDAYFLYHRLDRYTGSVLVRVSHKINFWEGMKKNRKNANIDFTMDGTCKSVKKKKF